MACSFPPCSNLFLFLCLCLCLCLSDSEMDMDMDVAQMLMVVLEAGTENVRGTANVTETVC